MAIVKKKSRPPGGKTSGLAIGAAIIIAGIILQFVGALDGLERRMLDLHFVVRGETRRNPDILLVTIDEATRKTMGKAISAISRKEYAKVLDALTAAGAKLVAFDLDLATSKEGDDELAQSIACAGNVILSSYIAMGDWVRPAPVFRNAEAACPVEGAVLEAPSQVVVNESGIASIEWTINPDRKIDGFKVYYSLQPFTDPTTIPAGTGGYVDVKSKDESLALTVEGVAPGTMLYTLVQGARLGSLMGEGAVNIIEDPDARVRRLPLIVGRSGNDPEKRAALALEIAVRVIFNEDPKLISSTPWELSFQANGNSLTIPLVNNSMLINYSGGRDTYPRMSFNTALEGHFSPNVVKGKIVLIGNTHQLAHDEYPTPFGRQKVSMLDTGEEGLITGYTSGLEIHANAVDTILSRNFIYPLSLFLDNALMNLFGKVRGTDGTRLRLRLWDAALVFLVGVIVLALLVLRRFSLPMGGLIFVGIMMLLAIGSHIGFVISGLWIPLSGPFLVSAGVYTGSLLHRARLHEREKRWIKETFGKYLAPAVVEQITNDPSLIELGGAERELTAFFSDIEKFSTISEQLGSPKLLVELLNEYLTAMSDLIEQYDGTIDKYEGDAVIAFWGAPAHFPDHALKACYACLDMQAKLKELRERWRSEGRWPPLVENMHVRMGLNTGPMVVGNIGSSGHLSYTIMGDAVNLASRLEGANKVYGTHIMISHDTYWLVRGNFEVRFLDIIAVVGKGRPVRVYELLARRGQLDPQNTRMVRAYNDGIMLYRKQQWQEALSSFEAALHFVPDDGPSKTYIERCRRFLQEPPPPDWDGVFKLESK